MRPFAIGSLPPLRSDDELLTVRQVAPLLGCHYETVKLMAREGRLPMVMERHAWRIRRSALERWLRENAR
jgi:excisionase family DNA binding protein